MIRLNLTSEAGEYKSISLRAALLLTWLYNWAKPPDLFGPQFSQKRKGGCIGLDLMISSLLSGSKFEVSSSYILKLKQLKHYHIFLNVNIG